MSRNRKLTLSRETLVHLSERVRRTAVWTPAVLAATAAVAALAGCESMVCTAACTIGH
jgi:hypothetical protein